MGKYQVFSIKDPKVSVITTVEAPSKEAAQAKARAMSQDYAVVPVLSRAASTRESGGVRTITLRESHSLPRIYDAVIDALVSIDSSATDPDVRDDGLVTYHSGERIFQRAYQISDGDSPDSVKVTLGNAEEVEMVAQPKETYRGLLRVSEAFNPGASDNFHSEFLQGRGSGDPLEDIGRAFGLEGSGLGHFIRGRD